MKIKKYLSRNPDDDKVVWLIDTKGIDDEIEFVIEDANIDFCMKSGDGFIGSSQAFVFKSKSMLGDKNKFYVFLKSFSINDVKYNLTSVSESVGRLIKHFEKENINNIGKSNIKNELKNMSAEQLGLSGGSLWN